MSTKDVAKDAKESAKDPPKESVKEPPKDAPKESAKEVDPMDVVHAEIKKSLLDLSKEELVDMCIEATVDLEAVNYKLELEAEKNKAEETKRAEEEDKIFSEKIKSRGGDESVFKNSTREQKAELLKMFGSNTDAVDESNDKKRKNSESSGPAKITKSSLRDIVKSSIREVKTGKSSHTDRDFEKNGGSQGVDNKEQESSAGTVKYSAVNVQERIKAMKSSTNSGEDYQTKLAELKEKASKNQEGKGGWE